MKTWIKVLLVTAVVGVPAFMLGPVLWPNPPGGPEPTAAQLPYFVFLAVWDAVLMGLGIAFLLFGWPAIRAVSPGSGLGALAIYLSIGWLTVSWWPHLNLHRANAADLQGLLYIDYGFHVPLMVAAVVLIYGFISIARERREAEPTYTVVRGPGEEAPLAENQAQ